MVSNKIQKIKISWGHEVLIHIFGGQKIHVHDKLGHQRNFNPNSLILLFQSYFAHLQKLGKLESSKSCTTVLLVICRMDIAFARFASTIVIKDTLLYFLKMTPKAFVIVASKAHEAQDLATCSKVHILFSFIQSCST